MRMKSTATAIVLALIFAAPSVRSAEKPYALQKKLDATGIANELHTGIQYRQGNALIVNWLKTQFK